MKGEICNAITAKRIIHYTSKQRLLGTKGKYQENISPETPD